VSIGHAAGCSLFRFPSLYSSSPPVNGVGFASVALNKGDGPWISLSLSLFIMKNCLSPIVIDLGRTIEFRKTLLVNFKWTTCVEFADADGFSVVRNHIFFLNVWFQRDRCEAMRSVAIMENALVPR
jgi:hypothetical protein